MGLWHYLTIVAGVTLLLFWKRRSAAWGGMTFGIIIGLVIAIFSDGSFSWYVVGKSMVIGTLFGGLLELPTLIVNLNPLKKVFQLNPSGEFLMDFCFVCLWFYDEEVKLITSRSLKERLQFIFVKKKTIRIIKKVSKIIYYDNCLEFDLIFRPLVSRNDNEWDRLLYCIVIKCVAKWAPLDSSLTLEARMNKVLAVYLDEIKENQGVPKEILNLKIERIKIQSQMDLLQATVASKNRTGQFASPLT